MMSPERIGKSDTNNLRHFFGLDAAIRYSAEGRLMASGKLKDGFCPGGQNFEVEVSPRRKVMQYHLGTDYLSPTYDAYSCNKITVNGMTVETPPVLFVPPSPVNRVMDNLFYMLSDGSGGNVDLATMMQSIRYNENTHAEVSHIPHFIALNSFHTADDLGALFHEIGEVHTGVSEKRAVAVDDLKRIRKSLWVKALHGLGSIAGGEIYQNPKFSKFGIEIFKRLRTILMSERQASQYAVKQIRHLNQDRKLFPDDIGNVRLRNFYQTMMLTYRKWGDGYYERFLGNDQKRELDQLVYLK